MADYQFLRLEKPDVLRYLPAFLAKDEHFKKIQDALSMEHEKQRQALIDLTKQFFVDDATWGLTAWENIYQTNPPNGARLELRRALLKAKMMGNRTMTKANLELLINQFVANKDAYIIEETSVGCFKIVIPSPTPYWDDLLNMLMEMVPAHLVLEISYEKDFATNTIYQGGILSTHKKHVVGVAAPNDQSVVTPLFVGSALSTHKKYVVGMQPPTGSTARGTYYAGGVLGWHKKYTVTLKEE